MEGVTKELYVMGNKVTTKTLSEQDVGIEELQAQGIL